MKPAVTFAYPPIENKVTMRISRPLHPFSRFLDFRVFDSKIEHDNASESYNVLGSQLILIDAEIISRRGMLPLQRKTEPLKPRAPFMLRMTGEIAGFYSLLSILPSSRFEERKNVYLYLCTLPATDRDRLRGSPHILSQIHSQKAVGSMHSGLSPTVTVCLRPRCSC